VPPVPGVRFRQTTALRPHDRRDLGDGITVASWPRLAFDLAADLRQLEVVLADALRRRNVPVVPQTQLARLADGRTARIDLAVPEVRWGVELDIHPEHRTLDGSARDARRSRQVHLVGWQIEPVTALDLQDVGG